MSGFLRRASHKNPGQAATIRDDRYSGEGTSAEHPHAAHGSCLSSRQKTVNPSARDYENREIEML